MHSGSIGRLCFDSRTKLELCKVQEGGVNVSADRRGWQLTNRSYNRSEPVSKWQRGVIATDQQMERSVKDAEQCTAQHISAATCAARCHAPAALTHSLRDKVTLCNDLLEPLYPLILIRHQNWSHNTVKYNNCDLN